MRLHFKKIRPALPGLLFLIMVLAVGSITLIPISSSVPAANAVISKDLPVVGSLDNLKKLLEDSQNNSPTYRYSGMFKSMDAANSQNAVAAPTASGTGAMEYSQTNTQVQGVDEADLVKTDGKYIYQVNKDQIIIINTLPVLETKPVSWSNVMFSNLYQNIASKGEMKVSSRIQFNDNGFTPVDLYLDGNQLIVIGSSYIENMIKEPLDNRAKIMPPYPHRNYNITKAIVYDVKDKNNVVKVRELELEGSYLTSRKVGSCFYLIANKPINYYYIQNGEDDTPSYRDSVKSKDLIPEKLDRIHYFPACVQPNYMMIAALDLNKPNDAAQIQTYLGSGENVYASLQNLYVALTDYDSDNARPQGMVDRPLQTGTRVYKFALEGSKVTYTGEGKVPGTILNQFSIDEYGEYCRIATTSGDLWRSDQYGSRNNVYVLNKDLQISGKLEDIAPGEKIYSTRFMGDRAYMVTFKKVDPFFVLDLKDPQNPRILGKLKIPGYSDYLHPYDENHIIGFGKDTIETKGYNDQSQAFYQGMKIAIFDVTDVNNPVQMSREIIGDRGTDSELLRNHKALLFSREKDLLAFPVNLMQIKDENVPGKLDKFIPEYGTFTFQGAYVYKIDLTNGLQLQGRITHLSQEDYLKAGDNWYVSDKNVERIIYIGDTLYTLSNNMIKAHNITDMKEIGSLSLR